MSARTFVIDIDDGPDGGSGPALVRALHGRKAPFVAVAFDPMSSGFAAMPKGADVRLIDPQTPTVAEPPFRATDRVIGTTPRAWTWIAKVAASPFGKRVPLATIGALSMRPGMAFLDRPLAQLPAPEFEIHAEAPERETMLYRTSGYLLSASGRLRAVADGEEAWYRLRQLGRRGDLPAAFIHARRAKLLGFSVVVKGKRLLAAAAVAIDDMHDFGRTALARTIDPAPFADGLSALAKKAGFEGIAHGFLLRFPDQAKPRLITLRPGPPHWLDALGKDGGPIVEDWLRKTPRTRPALAPAGRFVAMCPADRPVFANDIVQRIRTHGEA